ncbi:FUSC family protein [Psychrobacter okhotskensis]|uniref:FUSC family protein n=1 Tax=Psychrobacter okhotskensis TaxID=212403 RepID=UPI00156653B4|nr:FUSC family protein [Psychrobacter okhotskensis]
MKPKIWQRFIAPFIEPYARYQHADILHAIRIGAAIVLALLANQISRFPHGEWTTITVFIILGLLQYQGAIYTKAKERVLGTVLGIVVAFSILWFNKATGAWLGVEYLLIGISSGVIGYFSVRRLGYTGLLTGITMLMIVSNLNQINIAQDGVYRALNILIGTGIAVMVTVVLPLKSTLMWRFLLANNLEACSTLYAGVGHHIDAEIVAPKSIVYTKATSSASLNNAKNSATLDTPVNKALIKSLQQINKRLLAVRPHIAATASESGIDKETIETIQRTHRNIIGTIDLLLSAAPHLANIDIDDENHTLLIHYQHELTQAMQHIAAVLRSPSDQTFRPITRIALSEYPSVQTATFEWQGYFWLTQTLQTQLRQLSDLLQVTKPQWYAASGLRYQRREQRRMKEQGGESDLHL